MVATSSFDLTGKVAIVTGSTKGIGRAMAAGLSQAGAKVVISSRKQELCDEVAEKIATETGNETLGLACHVGNWDDVPGFVGQVHERFGRIDVLVNNAGIMIDTRGSRFLDAKLDTYRDTLETNLFGPLQLAQAVVPLMKAHRYGRIVNVSSGLGQLSEMGAGTPAYRISKTALNALTRILAAEFKDSNILVNSMFPGWVKTRMGGESAPHTPEQAADTAAWLATLSDDGPTGGFFRDRKPTPW
jgi:NAD(P)-dependent dehydrogenase (short-subunit alcohol dehydrogenase family)